MQTISWSPQLHSTVKKVKALDPQEHDNLLSDKRWLSTFPISSLEEKSLIQSIRNPKKQQMPDVWT